MTEIPNLVHDCIFKFGNSLRTETMSSILVICGPTILGTQQVFNRYLMFKNGFVFIISSDFPRFLHLLDSLAVNLSYS